MQFNHVGISVSDLDRSIAFYRDKLGMTVMAEPFPLGGQEVEDVTGLADLALRVGVVGNGSLVLELFEFANPVPRPQDPNRPVSDHGITHFGVVVEDIAVTHASLVAQGVRFHSGVRQFPGGVRAVYGRDPDGNVFELLQMPGLD